MSDYSELLMISKPKQPYDPVVKRRYYLKHREERIKYQIEYYNQHKEEYKQYLEDNVDKIRAKKREWYKNRTSTKVYHNN